MNKKSIKISIKVNVYTVLFAIGNISWGWTPPQFLATLH